LFRLKYHARQEGALLAAAFKRTSKLISSKSNNVTLVAKQHGRFSQRVDSDSPAEMGSNDLRRSREVHVMDYHRVAITQIRNGGNSCSSWPGSYISNDSLLLPAQLSHLLLH